MVKNNFMLFYEYCIVYYLVVCKLINELKQEC